MQLRAMIGAVLAVGVGVVTGTAVVHVDVAHAGRLAQSVTITNTPVRVGSATRVDSYASGFRAAYLPVVTTLHQVTPACATVTRVDQLPACGARVVPFRAALAHLLQFVTQTPPPASAKTDVRTLATSIKVLQQRFATLAAIITKHDLARFKAMGGEGHPIDNAINAFKSAVGNVVLDVPGLRVPLP